MKKKNHMVASNAIKAKNNEVNTYTLANFFFLIKKKNTLTLVFSSLATVLLIIEAINISAKTRVKFEKHSIIQEKTWLIFLE